ncbi:ribbon-helix-helix domain-containing protein [Kiloniella sp. b19]|uniref:ribbon-helix-helix domain-containing protein n=1 Tax=Kiloniella sp. GXU_MW_B19 TaxID=3141326 RepID=UPI0031E36704
MRLGRIAGQSGLEIRNVMASGRRTSVRLEPVMWDSLEEISRRERVSMPDIFTLIDQRRGGSPFTGAIRLFVLTYFRVAALADPNF